MQRNQREAGNGPDLCLSLATAKVGHNSHIQAQPSRFAQDTQSKRSIPRRRQDHFVYKTCPRQPRQVANPTHNSCTRSKLVIQQSTDSSFLLGVASKVSRNLLADRPCPDNQDVTSHLTAAPLRLAPLPSPSPQGAKM